MKDKAERERVIEILREWLPVGTTLYGIVVHVSASGMSRSVRFMHVEQGEIKEIPPSWVAAASPRMEVNDERIQFDD